MKVGLKNLLTRKEFLVIAVFFFLLLLLFYFIFFTPNHYVGKSPVQFEITKGESFSDVVDSLYEKGIIPNKTNMKIAGFIYGAGTKVRAARFTIPNGLSYLSLLDLFINGKAEFMRTVDIRDGLSVKWLAYVLKEMPILIPLNLLILLSIKILLIRWVLINRALKVT